MQLAIKSWDPELSSIIQQAYAQSGLVRTAFHQMFDFHQQVADNQNALLQQNQSLVDAMGELDLPSLQHKVLQRIDNDLSYVQQMNQWIGSYPDQNQFTWSLRTNKMELALNGAKAIVADEHAFTSLLHGHLPADYSNDASDVIQLNKPSHFYGNSNATFMSSALVEVNLSLRGDDAGIQDIQLHDNPNWIDQAALAHVTPIPDWVDISMFGDQFSFSFSDATTPQGLAFIHTGYAFGGQTDETRYAGGKTYGPEDCSSWLAKLIDSPVAFSTIDELFAYRMGLPEAERGHIDPNWENTNYAKIMDVLNPILIENPLTDIEAGQVIAFRKFDSDNHQDSAGLSGHTGVVLGVRENGSVITLNYARNMPDIEGFGVSEYPWQSSEKRETFFFNVKSPASLSVDDLFSDVEMPMLAAAQADQSASDVFVQADPLLNHLQNPLATVDIV